MPAELDLDPRGRRLRAALAAVLVRADEPELRLVDLRARDASQCQGERLVFDHGPVAAASAVGEELALESTP